MTTDGMMSCDYHSLLRETKHEAAAGHEISRNSALAPRLLSTLFLLSFYEGNAKRTRKLRVYASHILYTHTHTYARPRAHIHIYTLVYLTNQKPGTKNLTRFRIGHMQLVAPAAASHPRLFNRFLFEGFIKGWFVPRLGCLAANNFITCIRNVFISS